MQKAPLRVLAILGLLAALILTATPPIQAQDNTDNCINTYMVLDGDTLSGIAKRFNVDMGELAQLNSIENPSYIQIGDVLCLDGLVEARPAPDEEFGTGGPTTDQPATDDVIRGGTVPPTVPGTVPNTSFSSTINGRTYTTDTLGYYTVQQGDRLYRVGLAFGVPASEIARINNLSDSDFIYPGQQLLIPRPQPSRPVPGAVPAISIVPTIAGPGDTVTVRGYNYPANTEVDLYLEKTRLNRRSDVLQTVTTNASGQFETEVIIPATWPDSYPITSRTVSISGRTENNVYWGMNFFINRQWSATG
ncbi:MAG: LysM peptidoglycan-binding domain-containing protein [Chloroflexi bacterium]|nr:LysM peptidoglycan-binding domain-containing protein [Chloroflexota bacterium]